MFEGQKEVHVVECPEWEWEHYDIGLEQWEEARSGRELEVLIRGL